MNILFYLHRYPEFGGVEKVTEVLTQYLSGKEGYEISILSYIQNEKSFYDNDRISYYKMPDNTFTPTKANVEFIRFLITEKEISIIVFQDSYAPIEDVLFNASKGLNCKIITVEHNTPDCGWANFNYKYRYLHQSFKNWILFPYHYWYMSYHTKKRLRKVYTKSDKYVLLSQEFLPILKERFNIKTLKKCLYINNPITISTQEDNDKLNKKNELLFVGRFSKQKGIDILLNIWQQIYQDYPDWTLKLVGGGELEEEVLHYIKNNKLQNVVLEGFHTCTTQFYDSASILCMTSIFEGWGLVLTEAMSRGCIPIAFQSFKSITDIIDNNENGILISPFNQKEYINNLKSLMNDKFKRDRMSIKAIEKSKKFNIENIGKEWEKLFTSIIQ